MLWKLHTQRYGKRIPWTTLVKHIRRMKSCRQRTRARFFLKPEVVRNSRTARPQSDCSLVYIQRTRSHNIQRTGLLCPLFSLEAGASSQLLIPQQLLDLQGKLRGISGRNNPARLSLPDHLRHACGSGDNRRDPGKLRFRNREGLRVLERGLNIDVGSPECSRNIVQLPGEMDLPAIPSRRVCSMSSSRRLPIPATAQIQC